MTLTQFFFERIKFYPPKAVLHPSSHIEYYVPSIRVFELIYCHIARAGLHYYFVKSYGRVSSWVLLPDEGDGDEVQQGHRWDVRWAEVAPSPAPLALPGNADPPSERLVQKGLQGEGEDGEDGPHQHHQGGQEQIVKSKGRGLHTVFQCRSNIKFLVSLQELPLRSCKSRPVVSCHQTTLSSGTPRRQSGTA